MGDHLQNTTVMTMLQCKANQRSQRPRTGVFLDNPKVEVGQLDLVRPDHMAIWPYEKPHCPTCELYRWLIFAIVGPPLPVSGHLGWPSA